MDVSVIIVNYLTKALITPCITSIREMTTGLQYEIIVVDNASADGSVELIRKDFPEVRLIANTANVGFGRGNNIGISHATGAYCLLLNPDTYLLNNALKIMYDFMEREENSSTGLCGAALSDEDGVSAVSFGRFPTGRTLLFYSLPFTKGFRSGEGKVVSGSKTPFAVDFVSGADLFIRKSLLEELGAFDETFFAYYEETDLALRAAEAQFSAAIVPEARICHLEGKSFRQPLRRQKIMFESSLHYLQKHACSRRLLHLYCRLNEFKYTIYRLCAGRKQEELYRAMISRSQSCRK